MVTSHHECPYKIIRERTALSHHDTVLSLFSTLFHTKTRVTQKSKTLKGHPFLFGLRQMVTMRE